MAFRVSPGNPLTLPAGAKVHRLTTVRAPAKGYDGRDRDAYWCLTAFASPEHVIVEAFHGRGTDLRIISGNIRDIYTSRPWGGYAEGALGAAVAQYGRIEDWPVVTLGTCWGCGVNAPASTEERDGECPICMARAVAACVDCGLPDPARYGRKVRERMLAESRCFSCLTWRDAHEGLGPSDVVTPEYRVYHIGDGDRRGMPSSVRGFGGMRFVIHWLDGREPTVTADLWLMGTVPQHLRYLFTPNGMVGNGESGVPAGYIGTGSLMAP